LDNEALRDVKGPLADYVVMEAPSKSIRNEFHRFLTSYVDENSFVADILLLGNSVYGDRIRAMCEGILYIYTSFLIVAESQSLEIDFNHLVNSNATLGYFLGNAPSQILKIFDEVAMEVTKQVFESYDRIYEEIHVRVANLPHSEALRDLRQTHLNTLVKVSILKFFFRHYSCNNLTKNRSLVWYPKELPSILN
jgi:DNA replication licensing factor MCM2